jgi:hypothetical protein
MYTRPDMRAWSLVMAALVLALGCGPSFQAIYEGDARFEHCYALEDDPSTGMQKKADCWAEWSKHYTYGQTRDRVEYASVRYRALSRVPVAPTDEAMMGAAPGEGTTSPGVTAPAPTNAFAPPPNTLDAVDAAAAPFAVPTAAPATPPAPDAGAPKAVGPPKAACVDGCSDSWQACKGSCADASTTCAACDKTYGKCVKGCF